MSLSEEPPKPMFFKFRSLHPSAVPWLSAATLWLLFEVPTTLHWDGISPTTLRPTGEFLVLSTAAWLAARANLGRAAFWCPGLLLLLLLVVRVDFTVYFIAMRAKPLLFEQLVMVQHFVGLITDLFTPALLLVILALLALAIALTWLVRVLLSRVGELAGAAQAKRVAVALSVLWGLVIGGTLLGPRDAPHAWVRWMVPELVANVKESMLIHRSVRSGIASSPYRNFQQLHLTRKPDVLVFFVESYGRVLAEHEATRPRWAAALADLDARLSKSGWHSASAFSTAPVSGGASWLAVGSIYFGAHVSHQGVFQRFVDGGVGVPSLPRFLEQQGYATVNLAPSVRIRAGIELENRYGFRTYLRQPDLEYRGPRMGWGVVPDQYTLGFAEERVLPGVQAPLFLHFHMVSSHLHWEVVPQYVSDWRSWNSIGGELERRSKSDTARALAERTSGGLTASLRTKYEGSVLYDLRVVEDFLSRRTRDTLVILMGDHQPPVLTSDSDSFDVPLHVLARDPAILQEFLERGFSKGLVPPVKSLAPVKHEGLFSLIVRALARADGNAAVPEYYADGVRVGS